MKYSIIIFLLSLLYGHRAQCQNKGLSGTWILGDRTVTSGLDYADAIPKRMIISINGNKISITKTSAGLTKDTVFIQELTVGARTEILKSNGRIKSEIANWLVNDKILIIESTLSKSGSLPIPLTKTVDTLKISDDGQRLKWNRDATAINAAEKYNYAVTGEYDLIDGSRVNAKIGIDFRNESTWDNIVATAKRENKFIFIDCYASWCGPCKLMDNNVYSTLRVGDFANDHFVSIKLQMDTTAHDGQEIKGKYAIASEIQTKYKINAFPTFLFFNPKGEIVHRDIGYYDAIAFVQILKDAVDSTKQYYKLMDKFKNGDELRPESLKFLALTNLVNGERDEAKIIAEAYIKQYLNKLDDSKFLTRENLSFLNDFPEFNKTTDRFFQLCYNKPAMVDSMLHLPDYAKSYKGFLILQEEFYSKSIKNNGQFSLPLIDKPDWSGLVASIRKKFPKINADSLLLTCKITWYSLVPKRENWPIAINALVKCIDNYGLNALAPFTSNKINDIITMHSNNVTILKKALRWQEHFIKFPTGFKQIDYGNYAGILYKLGRKNEALKFLGELISAYEHGNTKTQLLTDSSYLGYIKIRQHMMRGEKLSAAWGANNFH